MQGLKCTNSFQTGSGKTHTIGTAFGSEVIQPESLGVIPRAVEQIFETILSLKKQTNESDGFEPMFTINVQFIEVCDCSSQSTS